MGDNFLKDYEPVEERLRKFWGDTPEGRIETELVVDNDHVIVFKAKAWKSELAWATGFAHQVKLDAPPTGSGGKPNKFAPEWTSPYEVAETSAIGRALANLGYAPKGGRPSREEVSKAPAPTRVSQQPSGTGTAASRPQSDLPSSPGAIEPQRLGNMEPILKVRRQALKDRIEVLTTEQEKDLREWWKGVPYPVLNDLLGSQIDEINKYIDELPF